VEAVVNKKNLEWEARLLNEKEVTDLKLQEKDCEIDEQRAVAKKATIATGVSQLAARSATT